jgi:hypothetical protein
MLLILVLLATLGFALAGLGYLKRAVIGRARATQRCWSCRFDLGALPNAEVCPECGTPVVPPGRRPPTPARERVWLLACGVALLLPLGFAAEVYIRVREVRYASQKDARHAAAAKTLLSYIGGGANEMEMRRAVAAYMEGLVSDSTDAGVLIRGRMGSQTTPVVARLLDDPSIPSLRRKKFVGALMDEYRRVPVNRSTQADTILCDLLCGKRFDVAASANAGYAPLSTLARPLDAEEASLIIEALLDIQADHTRQWCQEWGVGIERAFARGLVTREQMERYLRNSLDPKVVLMPGLPPRAGDLVVFRIDPRWRAGTGIPVRLRFSVTDPAWKPRVLGWILQPLQEQQVESSGRFTKGVLALPDTPGKHRVRFSATLEAGADVSKDALERGGLFRDEESLELWKSIPPVTCTSEFELVLDLERSQASPVKFESQGLTASELGLRAYLEAAPPRAGTTTTISANISSPAPLDLAFDAVLVQDGSEFPLGWSLRRRIGPERLRYRAEVTGLDTSRPVTLLLKSSKGPLERPAAYPVFWEGSVELKDIRIYAARREADSD